METEFVDNWVILYGLPTYLLTDHGLQIVSNFVAAITAGEIIRHLMTNTSPPQTNRKVEQFSRAIVTCLLLFFAEHQEDWEQWVQLLAYAYNVQVHLSTRMIFFSSVLSHQLLGPNTAIPTSAIPDDKTESSQPQNFCSRFMRQWDFLSKKRRKSV